MHVAPLYFDQFTSPRAKAEGSYEFFFLKIIKINKNQNIEQKKIYIFYTCKCTYYTYVITNVEVPKAKARAIIIFFYIYSPKLYLTIGWFTLYENTLERS